jgi:shikimate 5-dehydrogenase
MLIYQGARAFELWTNTPAPIGVMRTAATQALDEWMQPETPFQN